MDISSGNVDFGPACPGTLMQELLRDQAEQVRKVTKFQTSFSQTHHFMLCDLPCKDLTTMHTFITSISALQELSVLSYEPDGSALWPAIFHHASSLRSLSIHTPPFQPANLKNLEMDISLSEAESFLASLRLARRMATRSSSRKSSSYSTPTIDAVLNHLPHLESIQITIPLGDEASSFSDEQIWDAAGCKYCPPPQRGVCENMAAALLERFPAGTTKKLKLRLTRRIWHDRAQSFVYEHCTEAVRQEVADGEVAVEARNTWGEYLPNWPGRIDERVWSRLMDEYRNGSW
ncbi:hypothetical protein QBC37DRAFT_405017 [Rhypophila decipiens]|uniref:Uncharacterized protein n=1 Tax=Rhypophila decipiens TaxID=261697 RepID=A0AAN6XXI3_9PEZI|nr:hypothetical protein QBC37DRAFT_405017 [Rhypophila decipiens]